MKLIDEKGRLFGKLNLFDLVVILLVIVGIIGMATRLISTDRETAEMKTATYQIEITSAQECFKTAYKVGDTLYEGDTLLGTVTAVEVTPNKAVQLTADGTPKEIESKLACDIKLTFTTEQFHNDGGYSIGTAEWLAGTSHVISNGFAVSTTTVRDIKGA